MRNKRSLGHIFSSSILEKGNINVRTFRLVLYSVPELNPQQIHLDFEASAILVILKGFSNAEINGCYLRIVLAEYPTSWTYSRLEQTNTFDIRS